MNRQDRFFRVILFLLTITVAISFGWLYHSRQSDINHLKRITDNLCTSRRDTLFALQVISSAIPAQVGQNAMELQIALATYLNDLEKALLDAGCIR